MVAYTKKHVLMLCEEVYKKAFQDGATNSSEKYPELKAVTMEKVETALNKLAEKVLERERRAGIDV